MICSEESVSERHFVASYLYDKMKRPISEISKLLRHTNVQTMERYLQLVAPHLRDTMRLLEGDVVAWLSGQARAEKAIR